MAVFLVVLTPQLMNKVGGYIVGCVVADHSDHEYTLNRENQAEKVPSLSLKTSRIAENAKTKTDFNKIHVIPNNINVRKSLAY